jgi:hypothetical protein
MQFFFCIENSKMHFSFEFHHLLTVMLPWSRLMPVAPCCQRYSLGGVSGRGRRRTFKILHSLFFFQMPVFSDTQLNLLHISPNSPSTKSSTSHWLDMKLEVRRFLPHQKKLLFCSSQNPNQFWGPPSLLFTGYRGLSERCDQSVKSIVRIDL